MIQLLALVALTQSPPAPKLWPKDTPRLVLEYRFAVQGEGRLDQHLFRVNRMYSGGIVLDRREAYGEWDFNFDTSQTDPRLIQTTRAKVKIDDERRDGVDLLQSWTADHTDRPVMTEASIELGDDGKSFDLVFGIGDTLGATDAVTTKLYLPGSAQTSTLGLTQIPNVRTANDEFRACTVRLSKLGRSEFTKSWPVSSLTGLKGKFQNRTLKVIVSVKISAIWAQVAD